MKKLPILSIFLVLLFAISCQQSKKIPAATNNSEVLYQWQWNLVEIMGNKVIVTSAQPYLVFTPGQVNSVGGTTGCNRLTGTFELPTPGEIKFSPLATTRMACAGTNVEPQFLEALQRVKTWSIIEKELTLTDGQVALAKFTAVKAAASSGPTN